MRLIGGMNPELTRILINFRLRPIASPINIRVARASRSKPASMNLAEARLVESSVSPFKIVFQRSLAARIASDQFARIAVWELRR